MDFFQVLHKRSTYIDVDILEETTPLPNPDPNTPSSSLTSLSCRFLVEFILRDSDSLILSDVDGLHFPSARLRRSPTLLFVLDTSSSWTCVSLELNRLGLEPMFHDHVVQALQDRVDGAVRGNERQCPALITLHVNIKRITRTQIYDPFDLVGLIGIANGSGLATLAAPLDHHGDYGGDDHKELQDVTAVETPDKGKADDNELFLEDVGRDSCLGDKKYRNPIGCHENIFS